MSNLAEIPRLYAVILAGGGGTRLWPLSRLLWPKQLLHLPGCRDQWSLLQETVARVLAEVPPHRMLVVTQQATDLEILRQLGMLSADLPAQVTLLLEPVGRNTAPAITWAARVLAARDPDAVDAGAPGRPSHQ